MAKEPVLISIESNSHKSGLPLIAEAVAAVKSGRIAEAKSLLSDQTLENIEQMIDSNPSGRDIIKTIAALLWKTGQDAKAEQWYKKILQWGPDAVAYDRLGCICQYTGRLTEAIEYQRKAIETEPNRPEPLANLARALLETGQVDEGIELLRKAVEKMPGNPQVHSNLLFRLHHLHELDPKAIFDEHVRWGLTYAPIRRAKTSHSNSADPDRKLRIGYISPDFRRNSVAYFFESLLDGHNPDAVETFGYGNVEFEDEFTERFKEKFDNYRNIYETDDNSMAELIEQDRIDILVDLAGHTGDNRLTAMAYKPAPIQVTYLGYPDTTGMEAIDYRLTDALAEPPGAQEFYTEELFFLPEGFLCYRPPDFAPIVSSLPADEKGYITFGSFNNSCKINSLIVELWSQILNACENSRLLLKIKGGDEPEIKERYADYFKQFGIGPERLDIFGWQNPAEHLKLYSQVDIALDTFPYNGTTTTCEALWMGVPVVSLIGNEHTVSRVGLSILTRVGLEFFTAKKTSEYVAKAVALAKNRQSLGQIRSSMRARIARSGLCHARAFTCQVEAAYRKMWQKWCRTQAFDVSSTNLKPDVPLVHNDTVICSAQSKPVIAGQGKKINTVRRLHIGGQMRHPDWEVFNIQQHPYVDHVGDAKDLSRFDNETFDELYASHVVEHFDYNGPLQEALKEWYRVLKPRGKLYISVPDMDALCRLFREREKLKLEERFHIMRMLFGGHIDSYDYHYVGLDFDILTAFLNQAGFDNIKRVENFGIFEDDSSIRIAEVLISLNVIASK